MREKIGTAPRVHARWSALIVQAATSEAITNVRGWLQLLRDAKIAIVVVQMPVGWCKGSGREGEPTSFPAF